MSASESSAVAAALDEPIPYVLTHPDDPAIGDVVTRSAKGKRFRVTGFWTAPYGQEMASLSPLEGYTNASAPVAQLVVIERGSDRG